jgi:hypothetical protein
LETRRHGSPKEVVVVGVVNAARRKTKALGQHQMAFHDAKGVAGTVDCTATGRRIVANHPRKKGRRRLIMLRQILSPRSCSPQ